MSSASHLEEVYKVFPWPEREGQSGWELRKRKAREIFSKVLKHIWVKELLERLWNSNSQTVRILDLCAGTGLGGIILAKTLKELYSIPVDNLELTAVDLRETALKLSAELAISEGLENLKLITKVIDVLSIHQLRREYDIILLYGLTTPHFSPWEIAKMLLSVKELMNPNSLLMIEESDRRYTILMREGYQRILPEGEGKETILSLHAGYNPLTGKVKRLIYKLNSNLEPTELEAYFWGVAELATIMSLIFSKIDVIEISQYHYMLLSKSPLNGNLSVYEYKLPSWAGNERCE